MRVQGLGFSVKAVALLASNAPATTWIANGTPEMTDVPSEIVSSYVPAAVIV